MMRVQRLSGCVRRAAAPRDIVLAMAALALLGLAGWYLTSSDRPPPLSDGPGLQFVCEACGKVFELTAAEVETAMRAGAGGDPRTGGSGGYPCKHCGEKRGVRRVAEPG